MFEILVNGIVAALAMTSAGRTTANVINRKNENTTPAYTLAQELLNHKYCKVSIFKCASGGIFLSAGAVVVTQL